MMKEMIKVNSFKELSKIAFEHRSCCHVDQMLCKNGNELFMVRLLRETYFLEIPKNSQKRWL